MYENVEIPIPPGGVMGETKLDPSFVQMILSGFNKTVEERGHTAIDEAGSSYVISSYIQPPTDTHMIKIEKHFTNTAGKPVYAHFQLIDPENLRSMRGDSIDITEEDRKNFGILRAIAMQARARHN